MLLRIPERLSKSLLAYTFHEPIKLYRINMRKYHNSLHKCSVQPMLVFFNHIGCKRIDPRKQMRFQKRLRILQRLAAFGIKAVGIRVVCTRAHEAHLRQHGGNMIIGELTLRLKLQTGGMIHCANVQRAALE